MATSGEIGVKEGECMALYVSAPNLSYKPELHLRIALFECSQDSTNELMIGSEVLSSISIGANFVFIQERAKVYKVKIKLEVPDTSQKGGSPTQPRIVGTITLSSHGPALYEISKSAVVLQVKERRRSSFAGALGLSPRTHLESSVEDGDTMFVHTQFVPVYHHPSIYIGPCTVQVSNSDNAHGNNSHSSRASNLLVYINERIPGQCNAEGEPTEAKEANILRGIYYCDPSEAIMPSASSHTPGTNQRNHEWAEHSATNAVRSLGAYIDCRGLASTHKLRSRSRPSSADPSGALAVVSTHDSHHSPTDSTHKLLPPPASNYPSIPVTWAIPKIPEKVTDVVVEQVHYQQLLGVDTSAPTSIVHHIHDAISLDASLLLPTKDPDEHRDGASEYMIHATGTLREVDRRTMPRNSEAFVVILEGTLHSKAAPSSRPTSAIMALAENMMSMVSSVGHGDSASLYHRVKAAHSIVTVRAALLVVGTNSTEANNNPILPEAQHERQTQSLDEANAPAHVNDVVDISQSLQGHTQPPSPEYLKQPPAQQPTIAPEPLHSDTPEDGDKVAATHQTPDSLDSDVERLLATPVDDIKVAPLNIPPAISPRKDSALTTFSPRTASELHELSAEPIAEQGEDEEDEPDSKQVSKPKEAGVTLPSGVAANAVTTSTANSLTSANQSNSSAPILISVASAKAADSSSKSALPRTGGAQIPPTIPAIGLISQDSAHTAAPQSQQIVNLGSQNSDDNTWDEPELSSQSSLQPSPDSNVDFSGAVNGSDVMYALRDVKSDDVWDDTTLMRSNPRYRARIDALVAENKSLQEAIVECREEIVTIRMDNSRYLKSLQDRAKDDVAEAQRQDDMARMLSNLINESVSGKSSSGEIDSVREFKYEELNQLSKQQLLALAQVATVKYFDSKKKLSKLKRIEKDAADLSDKYLATKSQCDELEKNMMIQSKHYQKMQKQFSEVESFKSTIAMQEKVIAKMQSVIESKLKGRRGLLSSNDDDSLVKIADPEPQRLSNPNPIKPSQPAPGASPLQSPLASRLPTPSERISSKAQPAQRPDIAALSEALAESQKAYDEQKLDLELQKREVERLLRLIDEKQAESVKLEQVVSDKTMENSGLTEQIAKQRHTISRLENEINNIKSAHERLDGVDKDQLITTVERLEAEATARNIRIEALEEQLNVQAIEASRKLAEVQMKLFEAEIDANLSAEETSRLRRTGPRGSPREFDRERDADDRFHSPRASGYSGNRRPSRRYSTAPGQNPSGGEAGLSPRQQMQIMQIISSQFQQQQVLNEEKSPTFKRADERPGSSHSSTNGSTANAVQSPVLNTSSDPIPAAITSSDSKPNTDLSTSVNEVVSSRPGSRSAGSAANAVKELRATGSPGSGAAVEPPLKSA